MPVAIDIHSDLTVSSHLLEFDEDVVKNEPMLFSCDVAHAWQLGGPITKQFLDMVLADWALVGDPSLKYVFDSRVHMLMKDWFPCIPGFHHDDVDRHSTENGQPNYENPTYRSKMAFALVGDPVCRTEFALGHSWFNIPNDDEIIYKVWHEEVERKVRKGELSLMDAPMGNICYFDDRTWHQGTKATGRGWRWFGRLTASHGDDPREPANEVRRQVQVYMNNPMQGW